MIASHWSRGARLSVAVLVLVFGTCFFLLTNRAEAQDGGDGVGTGVTIEQLQEQIALLMQQIAQLQGVSHAEGGAPQCVELSPNFTLSLGSSDRETSGQVGKLQRFLSTTGHYTYGEITGYFGPATERALQAWQRSQNIVTSGSPETTGYGMVGPMTRAAMARGCTNVPPVVPPRPQPDDLSCKITAGKSHYVNGDTITIQWTSVGASYVNFVADNSGKDNLYVSEKKRPTRGTEQLIANVVGQPDLLLEAVAADGRTTSCRITIPVFQTQEMDADAVAYINEVSTDATRTPNDVLPTTGFFKIMFDVTASDDDVYISNIAERSLNVSVHGPVLPVPESSSLNSTAPLMGGKSPNVSVNSLVPPNPDASSYDSYYKVAKGKTESFTLETTVVPGVTADYWVGLNAVHYREGSINGPVLKALMDTRDDFETDKIRLVGTPTPSATSSSNQFFTLSDVKSVTSRYVDPIPGAADDEYTEYVITLNNGKRHIVNGCGFCAPGSFDKAFYNVGYTGDVQKLIAMAVTVPNPNYTFSVSISGLAVKLSGITLNNGCAGYKIDWGDGKQDSNLGSTGGICTMNMRYPTPSHTYAKAGKYNITLKYYTGAVVANVPSVTKAVTVATPDTGPTVDFTTTVSGLKVDANFGLTRACPSSVVNWGDNTASDNNKLCPSGTVPKGPTTQLVLSHTYAKAGTYTITASDASGKQVAKTVTVIFVGPIASSVAPKVNKFGCGRTNSAKVADGKLACYGMWDYGNDFGDDKYMCQNTSNGTLMTGCQIKTPVCSSGLAKATASYSNNQLTNNATKLNQVASTLQVTPTVVKNGVAGLWEYSCVANDSFGSVQGAATSLSDIQGQIDLIRGMLDALMK